MKKIDSTRALFLITSLLILIGGFMIPEGDLSISISN